MVFASELSIYKFIFNTLTFHIRLDKTTVRWYYMIRSIIGKLNISFFLPTTFTLIIYS